MTRDPRHLRHARALAVCHRNEAADCRAAVAMWSERSDLALKTRVVAYQNRSALEHEIRRLFCLDLISAAQRDMALALLPTWARDDVDELLATSEAVLLP